MERSRSELLVEVARRVGRRFRLWLRGQPEPEDREWCQWLISPVPGYLETGPVGPWPWWAVEWVEVELSVSDAAQAVVAFEAAGLPVEIVGDAVMVSCSA